MFLAFLSNLLISWPKRIVFFEKNVMPVLGEQIFGNYFREVNFCGLQITWRKNLMCL
jgi:hypothetical protein